MILKRWKSLRATNKTKLSDKDIAAQISDEVITIWNQARVPTIHKDHIQTKLVELIDELKQILKRGSGVKLDSGPGLILVRSIEH